MAREFKINPEVNAKLEDFMKAEPGLVKFVKELPREQPEPKFLLRKMQDQQQKQGYDAKVKAWLEKPEQAELVKSLNSHHWPQHEARETSPGARQSGQNYIRNTGVKLADTAARRS